MVNSGTPVELASVAPLVAPVELPFHAIYHLPIKNPIFIKIHLLYFLVIERKDAYRLNKHRIFAYLLRTLGYMNDSASVLFNYYIAVTSRRGCDRMVVGFITT